jgi:hypothetical protein
MSFQVRFGTELLLIYNVLFGLFMNYGKVF